MLPGFLKILPVLFFAVTVASAGEKYIYLPPGENGFSVFPAVFDYQVTSKGSLRIGPREISANDIDFVIPENGRSAAEPGFSVVWPSNYFKQGTISLVDGVDRAIWSKKVDLKSRTKAPRQLSIPKAKAIFQSLVKTPIFRFCMSSQSETSQFQVCTEELSLSLRDGNFVLTHAPAEKAPSVAIDGKIVSNVGNIPLAQMTESSLFEMRGTGFRVKGFLRKPDFDFYHILYQPSSKSYKVYLKNANPENPSGHEEIGDDRWILHLSEDKSKVYLYDESNIPMFVSFAFRNITRWPQENISINQTQEARTYSENITVSGDGVFQGLTLPRIENAKNEVPVTWEQQNLKGRYDSSSYKSMIVDGGITLPASLRGVNGHLHAEKWFYAALGLSAYMEPRLYHKNRDTSYDFYEVSTLHRFDSYLFQQPGMGLKLNLGFLTINNQTFMQPGVGFYLHQRAFKFPIRLYDWTQWYFDYYMNKTIDLVEVKNHFSTRIEFYRFRRDQRNYYKLGFGMRSVQAGTGYKEIESFSTLAYGLYL